MIILIAIIAVFIVLTAFLSVLVLWLLITDERQESEAERRRNEMTEAALRLYLKDKGYEYK